MKVIVIVRANENQVEYEIPCGFGDKTFKWLANVASQRFSLSAPNGSIRSRDDIRGATENSQYLPSDMYLENGDRPHPSFLISDYLSNGDKVYMNLNITQPITKSSGSPTKSKWEVEAYSCRDNSSVDFQEDDNGEYIEDINSYKTKQANANFMKILLESQMLNVKLIKKKVNIFWDNNISIYFKNLKNDDIISVKNILINHWDLVNELFLYYCNINSTKRNDKLTLEQFILFLNDSFIFKFININTSLYSSIFNKTCSILNLSDTDSIDFIGFIISLILISQKRFHDTYDIKLKSLNINNSLNQLFLQYIRKLSIKLSFDSIIKEFFCSIDFLSIIRNYTDNLFLVFQEYASKSRILPLTLKYEFLSELLYNAKLQSQMDLISTKKLYYSIKKGTVIGRDVPKQDDEDEFEFTFPEFCEAVCRAGYKKYYQYDDKDDVNIDKDLIIKSFVQGIEAAIDSLKKPVNVPVEKSKKN